MIVIWMALAMFGVIVWWMWREERVYRKHVRAVEDARRHLATMRTVMPPLRQPVVTQHIPLPRRQTFRQAPSSANRLSTSGSSSDAGFNWASFQPPDPAAYITPPEPVHQHVSSSLFDGGHSGGGGGGSSFDSGSCDAGGGDCGGD